jgi:hypothetical protein
VGDLEDHRAVVHAVGTVPLVRVIIYLTRPLNEFNILVGIHNDPYNGSPIRERRSHNYGSSVRKLTK